MSEDTSHSINRYLMVVESTEVNTTPPGYMFLALINVVIWAVIGGQIVAIICQGWKTKYFDIKPCLPPSFQIPPLVGMIFFGMFSRNVFESRAPGIYYEPWADWVR